MVSTRSATALPLFGLAGACALLALYWSPFWIAWFGAAASTWQGVRALAGRLPPARPQDTEAPPPPGVPADPGTDGAARPGAPPADAPNGTPRRIPARPWSRPSGVSRAA